MVGAFTAMLVPGIGAGVSHLIDRFRFRNDASNELDTRAKWYRFQVAKQLGMNPENVTQRDLLLAAQMNPRLAKVVEEVHRKQSDNNRFSMLTSAGASVASFIPGGGVGVKAMAMSVGGAVSGGALATIMTRDRVDPQQVAEAINEQMQQAQQQGTDPRRAVTPQLTFMLRVSQDEKLAADIKDANGKAYHQMTAAEQSVVMKQYPALANAATSEAYALGNGMVPVQELMATSPNLNGRASKLAPREERSFVSREAERRALAAQAANIPSV